MSDPWNGCIYPHPASESCPGCSGDYDTPAWEQILLWVVLALMVLVVVAGLASAVLG